MKRILGTMMGVGLIFMLVACGGKVDDATSEQYISQSEEIVDLLNNADYEEVHAKFDDNMKTLLPVEDMNEFTPIIQDSGSFKEIDKASVEEDDGYYVTVLVAKYSEDNRVFTITFDEDDKIAGLFIQ